MPNMATETEANGVETLPSRLHRHLDLLLRIEEILREERTDLLQAGKDLREAIPSGGDAEELHRLRTENNELRQLVAEFEEQLTSRLERSNEAQLGLEEENAELRRSMH